MFVSVHIKFPLDDLVFVALNRELASEQWMKKEGAITFISPASPQSQCSVNIAFQLIRGHGRFSNICKKLFQMQNTSHAVLNRPECVLPKYEPD